MVLTLIVGFALAGGLVFGIEYLDTRLKTPADIKKHLTVPYLALVPELVPRSLRAQSPLINRGVPEAFAAAMHAIGTSVVQSSAAGDVRTVMVTSTVRHEGKTLVSTNLADALALTDRRTLLIDTDFRSPRAHAVFELSQEPGLANVLAGDATVHAAIRKTANPFLSVLPAGRVPENPAEVLASSQYARLLEELRKDYDWIVLDAPPVTATTDTAVTAHRVGGVVFVVGSAMTPRRDARVAIDQLTTARAKIVGAVLNRVNIESRQQVPSYPAEYTQEYARTR